MAANNRSDGFAHQAEATEQVKGTRQARFPATRWSIVAGLADASEGERHRALDAICRSYWLPLYAFARHQGQAPHDAEDLTQGFFEHLLSGDHSRYFSRVEGRLRNYLLGALKRYMIDEWRTSSAEKRGGGEKQIPLDSAEAHSRYSEIQSPSDSPEITFHRHWVLAVLENARERLKARYAHGEKRAMFVMLESAITDAESVDYTLAARELGMSEGSLRTAVHRLRRRYGEAIRDEIEDTVGEDEVEAEYQDLIHNFL